MVVPVKSKSKRRRRAGDGFLPAMVEVGFAEPGEELEAVWDRAVAAVHAFGRERDEGS